MIPVSIFLGDDKIDDLESLFQYDDGDIGLIADDDNGDRGIEVEVDGSPSTAL